MTDRASAEGLRALLDEWETHRREIDSPIAAAQVRAALRDTGPRPDSGIDALREAAYYAVETWVMYDVDEERMAALEKALGRSVGLENASLNDVRAALDARLATPRTETSDGLLDAERDALL